MAGIPPKDRKDIERVPSADLVEQAENDVQAWRTVQFFRMGFSEGEATALATSREADVHKVAEWLHQGCPYPTALRLCGVDAKELVS